MTDPRCPGLDVRCYRAVVNGGVLFVRVCALSGIFLCIFDKFLSDFPANCPSRLFLGVFGVFLLRKFLSPYECILLLFQRL